MKWNKKWKVRIPGWLCASHDHDWVEYGLKGERVCRVCTICNRLEEPREEFKDAENQVAEVAEVHNNPLND